MNKIALVYGTRFGGTKGVAEYIAKKMNEKGKEVILVDVKDKEKVEKVFSDPAAPGFSFGCCLI